MGLSSAFNERLELMQQTRDERLSLLQAEKELQANKSRVLESKFANIRAMEQRCSLLEHRAAIQSFKVSGLKSEIGKLEAKYLTDSQQLSLLKREVQELEELEEEKKKFYDLEACEMKSFMEKVDNFTAERRREVEQLKSRINGLKSEFVKLQGNNDFLYNSEIASAEMRNYELQAKRENLEKLLASGYERRAQLQRKLQNVLMTETHQRRK